MYCILMLSTNTVLFGAVAAILLVHVGVRSYLGRRKFKVHLARLEEEGLLRSEHHVLIRIHFPLLRRITFAHIYLSKRRLILFHFLTRGLILQAPLGEAGASGKEEGRFEVEKGKKKRLVFKTTIRGGGRIRMHLKDPSGWLADIVRH
jgi:hypothetical protein